MRAVARRLIAMFVTTALTATGVVVAGAAPAAAGEFTRTTSSGTVVHCRNWDQYSSLVYGWSIAPCIAINGSQVDMAIDYIVGSTDVNLHAQLMSVSGGQASPTGVMLQSLQPVWGTQGSEGLLDLGTVSAPSPGDYNIEGSLTESGNWYGFLQSPVYTYAASAPTYCYRYFYLDSRGSGDTSGQLSHPGGDFLDAFRKRLTNPGDVTSWINPYQAIGVGGHLNASDPWYKVINMFNGKYASSESSGESLLNSEIDSILSRCRGQTNIILGGYSQGAQVAGDVYANRPNDIWKVVLWGDPRFNHKSAAAVGTFKGSPGTPTDGIEGNPAISGSIRGEFPNPGNVVSFCNDGDFVCQDLSPYTFLSSLCASSWGFGGCAHVIYGYDSAANSFGHTYPEQAADYFLFGHATYSGSQSPGVSVTSFNVSLSGTVLYMNATATNADSVQYYLDIEKNGVQNPIYGDSSSTHNATFDTVAARLTSGLHSVAAVAMKNGSVAASMTRQFSVTTTSMNTLSINGYSGGVRPDSSGNYTYGTVINGTGTQSNPLTVGGTIQISGTETLAQWVMYYLDNANPSAGSTAMGWPDTGGAPPANQSPHHLSYDVSNLSPGVHTVTAVAFQKYGNGNYVIGPPDGSMITMWINVRSGQVPATLKDFGLATCDYNWNCGTPNKNSDQGLLGGNVALTAHEYLANWVVYYLDNAKPVGRYDTGRLPDGLGGASAHLLDVNLDQYVTWSGWHTLTAAALDANNNVTSTITINFKYQVYRQCSRCLAVALIQSGQVQQYTQATTGAPLVPSASAPAISTGSQDTSTAVSTVYRSADSTLSTQVIESDGLLHQVAQKTDGTWSDTVITVANGINVPVKAVSSVWESDSKTLAAAVIEPDGLLHDVEQASNGTWTDTTATVSGSRIAVTAAAAAYKPSTGDLLVQVVEGDGQLHQLVRQADGTFTDVTVTTTAGAHVAAKSVSSVYEAAKSLLVNQVVETDGTLHEVVQNPDGTWSDTAQGTKAKSVSSAYRDDDGSLTDDVVEGDGLLHQVIQKADGTWSDSAAVTSSGSHLKLAPTAALHAASTPGAGALAVTADASGSTPGGAAVTGYTFDFGDGTVIGPQAAPTATHTYASAGSYTVKVTVTDSIGLSATATTQATASATAVPASSHVGRIGTDAAKVTSTSTTVPVAAATKVGDALIVTVLLTSTTSGTVSATDTQGDTFTVVNDCNDGAANDRLLTLAAFNTKALGTADSVTVAFPSTQEHHIAVDEYAGISGVDTTATGSGPSAAAFATGSAAAAGAGEVIVGVVGTEGGDAPTLDPPYASLPTQQVGNDSLSSGYQTLGTVGSFKASGTVYGPWMAQATAFLLTGPPTLTAKLAAAASTSTPLAVTADASSSAAGANPIATYTFDFGDGVIVGPQAAPTATHAYAAAAAYMVKVTVTDSTGATSTKNTPVLVTAAPVTPIGYVGRIGADAAAATASSVTLPVASATKAGDALIITALLTNTSSGSVAATDTQGDTFTVVNDCNDGSAGDRLVTLAAFNTKALGTADSVTLKFPSTGEHHIAVDEYSGISGVDKTAANNGKAGTGFNSGATTAATSASELAIGVVGTESGSVPAFTGSGAYTALAVQQVSTDSLLSGYQVVTAGTASATGTATGGWLAQATTFLPGGPAGLTAKLSVGASASSPAVTADASASTPGSSQISGYRFDFGDNTAVVSQSTATAAHTYATVGTYTVKVTVLDAGGAMATASQTVTAGSIPPPAAIGYVGRVASDAVAATTTSLTLRPSSAAKAGDALVVSVMLTNVKSGTVGVTDSQGDSYAVVSDTADGAGDRTLVLAATRIKALATKDSITLAYPSNTEHHVAVDEFSGVLAVDQNAAATGSATTFNSGSTPTTTAAGELVIGTAGIQGGDATTWAAGFTALPTLFVSQDQLAIAYKIVTATGGYSATGSTQKTWMAAVTTLK